MHVRKTPPRKEWVLTKETFDRFLEILDSDRDQAGQKYENIRLKLLKFFKWYRSDAPDIDADETLNRVMRRIEEGKTVHNLNAYIHGVAKLVYAESLRRRKQKHELDDVSLVELASVGVDIEAAQREKCLKHCIECLNDEDREIVLEYYPHNRDNKIAYRNRLAARLGISLNVLRVKTHRIRRNLEACMKECLGRDE